MKSNWTTKSGKKVEITTSAERGIRCGSISSMTIDGKKFTSARRTISSGQLVIEFNEVSKTQKYMVALPAEIDAAITAEARTINTPTAEEIANFEAYNKAENEYDANYRKVTSAMNK